MKHETKQRLERRNLFISYALSKAMGADQDEVTREAGELFDKENPDHLVHCTPEEPCEECINNKE